MSDIFSQSALDQIVNQTLSEAHVSSTNAVVGAVDKDGVQVTAAFKWKDDRATWELQGVVRHEWSGDTSGQARLLLEW